MARTAQARFFTDPAEPALLYVWPEQGAHETLELAEEHVAIEEAWFRAQGAPGAVLVMLDRVSRQDRDARARHFEGGEGIACVALVGMSPAGRALASFSLAMSNPVLPAKFFAELPEARRWVRSLLQG